MDVAHEVPETEITPEINEAAKEEEYKRSLEIEEQVRRAAKLIRQTENKLKETVQKEEETTEILDDSEAL